MGVQDSADIFFNDTMKSSHRKNGSFTSTLVRRMVDDSSFAVGWIASRAGIEMETVAVGQLGGHTKARTHRPEGRLAGAAFISGLERAVLREGKAKGLLTIMKQTRMEGMRQLESGNWELTLVDMSKKKKRKKKNTGVVKAEIVTGIVLATGGYGHDKGPNSLLRETVPHLEHLRSTNGNFATGDGIKIARDIGADTIDLEMVQVHPTGFSDPPAGFVSSGSSTEDEKVPLM